MNYLKLIFVVASFRSSSTSSVGGYQAVSAPDICHGTPLQSVAGCIKCTSIEDCLLECQANAESESECRGFSVISISGNFKNCTLLQCLMSTSNCPTRVGTDLQYYKMIEIDKKDERIEILTLDMPSRPSRYPIDAFNPEVCGKGSTVHLFDSKQPSGKILGGADVEEGEFPYQVLIELYLNGTKSICGASLIDRQWILTAGHCLKPLLGEQSMNISIGRLDFSELEKSFVKMKTSVDSDNIHIHPKYETKRGSSAYDFGLIKLPRALEQFSSRVAPICLPLSPVKDYTNRIVVTTGWGYSNNPNHLTGIQDAFSVTSRDANGKAMGHPDRLQKLARRIVPQKDCGRPLSRWGYKPEIMMCSSKSGNRDQCNGDSGGPWALVDRPFGGDEPKWTLVGITSWGMNCGSTFGVGAKITDDVLTWIKETLMS